MFSSDYAIKANLKFEIAFCPISNRSNKKKYVLAKEIFYNLKIIGKFSSSPYSHYHMSNV